MVLTDGLASLIGAVGGSFLDGAFGVANNALSYQQNLSLQHDAQAWQERMSNTAHQREMQDLQKAGLNPILTATGGQGASTGSVGANSASPQAISPGATFMNMLNSSAQYDFTRSQADNMRQDSILKGTQVLTERQKVSNMIQELYESKSREGLNRSKIREIDININLMKKQMRALDSTIELNFLTGNQAKANTNLINSRIEQLQPELRWIKNHPVLSEWKSGFSGGSGLGSAAIGAGVGLYGASRIPKTPLVKGVDTTKSILKYLNY